MTKTFVARFLAAGGRLLPSTRATLLRREAGGWIVSGVAHESASDREPAGVNIRAGTVFVCGGAVQTPALLRRSGNDANVGDSLRLHPTIKFAAQFPDPRNS